jgi:hypothetical protein
MLKIESYRGLKATFSTFASRFKATNFKTSKVSNFQLKCIAYSGEQSAFQSSTHLLQNLNQFDGEIFLCNIFQHPSCSKPNTKLFWQLKESVAK